ncbi:hypothetical protein DPMN_144697 [Dreissena polymorpha]|uniref:Uncharacterized protein n=1 Tax=Dreissena polymorpha TaxID=45954 RepID=A0A9D4F6Z1_DREPO|nr:hypothetical protein DPMN_144697 [Dreissena polymorpha]
MNSDLPSLGVISYATREATVVTYKCPPGVALKKAPKAGRDPAETFLGNRIYVLLTYRLRRRRPT